MFDYENLIVYGGVLYSLVMYGFDVVDLVFKFWDYEN